MWELAFCGSWLACDAGNSVCQLLRADAIAGKPAPTKASSPTNQLPHKRDAATVGLFQGSHDRIRVVVANERAIDLHKRNPAAA